MSLSCGGSHYLLRLVLTSWADYSSSMTANEPELLFSPDVPCGESSSLFSPLPFFFLQRYEEAAQAFREVLKLDNSCPEAAQELMRVQITQLMVCNRNTCWWLAINGGGSWENGVTASKFMDN